MFTKPTSAPAGLAGAKQWMLAVLAGLVGLGVLLWWLFGLGSGSASAQTAATNFTPSVKITVPQTDADGNGANDLSGTRFDIGFSPAEGSVAGCTTTASGAYVVQDSGTVTVSGTAPLLVDRPAGETARCSYVIGWPNVDGLKLRAGATADVSATTPVDSVSQTMVKATYDAAFTPTITVTVPDLDENDDDNNDFAGTTVRISYRSRSGAGCSYGVEGYVVGNDGIGALSGPAAVLVKYPTSAAEGVLCVYWLSLTSNSSDTLVAPPSFRYSSSRPEVDADNSSDSFPLVTVFSPAISITVPQVDADGNSINDFSGAGFSIRFTREAGSHPSCHRSVSLRFSANSAGLVNSNWSVPILIDRPAGATSRCSYDLAIRDFVKPSVVAPGRDPLYLKSTTSTSVSGNSKSVSISYSETYTPSGEDNEFSPNVSVYVPQLSGDVNNDFSGAKLWLQYNSKIDGCPKTVFEKYTVDDDGVVSLDGGGISLDKRPLGSRTGAVCVYSVEHHSSSDEELVAQSELSNGGLLTIPSIEVGNSSASISFATAFTPNFSFSIPQVSSNGVNIFSRVSINVSYISLQSSNKFCPDPINTNYIISNSGTVSIDRSRLIDRPAKSDSSCSYDVQFNELILPYFGINSPKDPLYLQSNSSIRIQAGSAHALVTYVASYAPSSGVSSFVPDVRVLVPSLDANDDGNNDFSGAILWIKYSSRTTGCPSEVFEKYVVADDNTVSVVGTRVRLDAHPIGDSGGTCNYRVETYGTINGGELKRQYGKYSSINPSRRSTAISFVTQLLWPNISITIPQVDSDGDGINDFTRTYLSIEFRPVVGSNSGCTKTYKKYFVIDTGTVVTYSGSRILVDRPGGSSSRCSYDVIFPDYVPPWSGYYNEEYFAPLYLDSSSVARISATGGSASASYAATYTPSGTNNSFNPDVIVVAPLFDEDSEGSDDFSDNIIWVRYASSAEGCARSVFEKYIIGGGGILSLEGRRVSLDRRPDGATGGPFCSYEVYSSVRGNRGLVRQSSAFSSSFIATSSRRKINFVTLLSPSVAIEVPNTDADSDGNNDFTGMDIQIDYSRASEANVGCPTSLTQNYMVKANGDVEKASGILLLIDRPAGTSSRCSYDVSFPDYVSPQVGSLNLAPLYIDSSIVTPVSASGGSALASYTATYTPSGTNNSFDPNATVLIPQVGENNEEDEDFADAVLWIKYSSAVDGCPKGVFEKYLVDNDGAVAVSGTEINLDRAPVDASEGEVCSYNAELAVISDQNLVQQPDFVVSGISATGASFSLPLVTLFPVFGTVFISMLDDNSDNNHDLGNTELIIGYSRVTGSNSGCSSSVSEAYSIETTGYVWVPGMWAELVDRPAGVTTKCSYDVTWPTLFGLKIQDGFTSTVNSSNAEVSGIYLTIFSPDISITVPQIDTASGAINDFSGTNFTVQYTPVSGSEDGCSGSTEAPKEEIYSVADDGTVSGPATSIDLVDHPSAMDYYSTSSASTTCSYDVAFVNTNENLRLQSDVFSSISKSNKAVSASYDGVFSASVRINVPRRGFSNSGVSFRVRYAPKSTQEVPGTHCSGYDAADDITDDEVEDYIVGTESKVVVSGDKAVLMDRLAGSSVPCSYTVIFPATAAYEGLGLVFDDDNSDDIEDEVVVSASSKNASADYQRIRYFSPSVSIYIESDSQNSGIQPDSRIRINYTRNEDTEHGNPSGACTESTWEEHTVDVDRGTERDGLAADLAEYQPGNDTKKCVYNVEVVWENMPSNLILQPGTATSTTTVSNQVLVVYTAGFSPEVAFSIPQFDGDTSGENAFSETRIIVRFKQDNSMQGNAVEKCSLSGDEEVSETYVVNANGTVGEAENEVYLVDFIWEKVSGTYAKSTVCEYTATFASMVSGLSWDASELDLSTEVQVQFNSAGVSTPGETTNTNSEEAPDTNNGEAANENGDEDAGTNTAGIPASYDATFVPDVAFMVPVVIGSTTQVHRYSGADLEVSFYVDVGSNENCGDSANRGVGGAASVVVVVNYTIQNSGAIVPNGTEPRLMHGFSGSSEKCSYSVLLPGPISSAGDSSLSLNLESLAYTGFEVGASIPAVYSSMLVPGIGITLPSDGEGNSASLIGTTFVVSFSLESGSASICTSTNNVSLRYRVQADGSVSLVSNPLSFVDGAVISSESGTTTEECTYRATIVSLPPGRLVYNGSPVIVSGNDSAPEVVFSRVT